MFLPVLYQELKEKHGLHWQQLILDMRIPNHGYITLDQIQRRYYDEVHFHDKTPDFAYKCITELTNILENVNEGKDDSVEMDFSEDVIVLVHW